MWACRVPPGDVEGGRRRGVAPLPASRCLRSTLGGEFFSRYSSEEIPPLGWKCRLTVFSATGAVNLRHPPVLVGGFTRFCIRYLNTSVGFWAGFPFT